MGAIGALFKVVGYVVWFATGLWGFFLCLAVLSDVAGFLGIVGGLMLGPVTFVAAPLYAGFAWGNWFPLVLNYGGSFVALIFLGIGSALSKS